ncbi:SusD/RagB family nutrient-binding outer membrane lipoprotein [Membranihabitans marinus]|uniref:SusD/RagB family nutrient-binding outer membrane lipoprotein n=1 Tax=Membranihabitans marinus TaxID=1227546 RepID=UPI001F42EECA|nr:SusD/RagB family nutrient-binding outer membrane lipoprotein [Membranihabitans marinus]
MKNYILFLLLIGFLACSTDNFEDLNTDKKNPSTIPANPLFTNAAVNLVTQMSECEVNYNVFRLYAQYWSQTTYPDESQYNMVTRNIPDKTFEVLYANVLVDLQECEKLLNQEEVVLSGDEEVRENKIGIIGILEVFTYATLVDIFGDVPYSEALQEDIIQPKYDKGEDIYTGILLELDESIAKLKTNFTSFGSEDPIYGGDVEKWLALAYSLKLKLGMRLADMDSDRAKAIVESAYDKVFTDPSQSALMQYYSASPNTNPLYENLVLSGRNDFLPANTIVDIMNDLNDPRRALYYDVKSGTDEFVGGVYGEVNAYSLYSHLASVFLQPTLPGNLLDYTEVQFLLAEAAARGYNVGGTASEYYNEGIKASILFWGGSQEQVDDYLAQTNVAYETAEGDWRQKIAVQKWISLFNNGFEGWTTWRIFDYPIFNPPSGLTIDDIPKRMIFPVEEATLNGPNVKEAATRYNNDNYRATVFWDMN